jgi:hypothetical protein
MAADDMISKIEELDLTPEEKEAALRMIEEERKLISEREAAFDQLARSIETKFFSRASQRKIKEAQWRTAAELYLGNLSLTSVVTSDNPFNSHNTANRPYYNLVANKCDIAIAQSVDMQFAGGEKNWSLGPAQNEIDQTETEKARMMEQEIETQLEHCNYGRKVRRAIEDRVIYGSGILKGPVNTGTLYTYYAPMPEDPTVWFPQPAVDKQPSIEWVNPWLFFPDDSVNDFNKVGDTIEVHPSSVFDLKKLMNHPGFIPDAIMEVLKTPPDEYLSASYMDFVDITESNPYLFRNKYMLLEYHGPITADQLAMLSVDPPAYEPLDDEYYGEVWVCAGKVIRVELENIEASFEVPYALSTWKKDPTSVFGFGSPLLMKDSQRVARETWRMILDNASLSSGPQVALHRTFVEPQNGSWELHPGKAWNLLDSGVDVEKAIQFFDVPNMTGNLLPILDKADQMAEQESMTPMIAGGLQGADVQESATGQLMMREASTTVLDFLSEDWDDNVTEKIIRRMYGWNMQYNPDPTIKGNYSVDVRTSTEHKNKQMFIRDLERLSMEVKQDPELAMMINRDELTKTRLSVMHIPFGAIVKRPEEIEAARQQAAQQAQNSPEHMEAQIEMERLKVENRKLDLQEAELAFEKHQQQKREEMDHLERMAANRARELEAMATVTRTQNEKEIQYLQLAQRAESEAQRNQIMGQIAVLNDATKKFQIEVDARTKTRDQILLVEEMKMKNEFGTGI